MTWQQRAAGKNGRRVARVAARTGAAVVLAFAAAAANTGPAAARHLTGEREPAAAVQAASDSPAGFWYGTDSSHINIPGPAPYHEPVIGGFYGGYIGMTGNWANLTGCHKIVVWDAANNNQANNNQANNNYTWHHKGIGTGVYYFMGGPGVDPHYNGTVSEAYSWCRSRRPPVPLGVAPSGVACPVLVLVPGCSGSRIPCAGPLQWPGRRVGGVTPNHRCSGSPA
jgi:hypothetical protein